MDEVKSFSVENQVCLVTGGAAGIGAGIVKNLLLENALHVAFLDVAEQNGAALETQLNNKFGALRAKFIKCDIANEDELGAAYKLILDKYHRLDVVVNNAAILSADEKDYTRMVNVNFTAAVNSTFMALDIMRQDREGCGGAIVNISSLLAVTLNNNLPVYDATKTAVLQFSNAIGREPQYCMTGVRVLTVCLGPTDTAIMYRHNLQNFVNEGESYITSTDETQRVESAAAGVVEVIKNGESGSTWRVADDKPAEDITANIKKAYKLLRELLDL